MPNVKLFVVSIKQLTLQMLDSFTNGNLYIDMNSPQAFRRLFKDFEYTLDEFLQLLRNQEWGDRDIENVKNFINDAFHDAYLHSTTLNAIEDLLPEPMRAYYFHLRMIESK